MRKKKTSKSTRKMDKIDLSQLLSDKLPSLISQSLRHLQKTHAHTQIFKESMRSSIDRVPPNFWPRLYSPRPWWPR